MDSYAQLPDREALAKLLEAAARPEATTEQIRMAQRTMDGLFAMHRPRILQLCSRYERQPEKAAELAQDTFLTAYQKRHDYTGTGSFYSWLYGIARNKCANAHRRITEMLTDDGVLDEEDGSRDAFRSLRDNERFGLLRAASTAVLDGVEQEAVYLRYERGASQRDLTELLGLTQESGGRGLLQRCRRKLRRELRRRLQELGHTSSFFRDSEG